MAEKSTLARPYAQAAFKQASEEGQLDQWAEMLDFLGALASDRMMVGLLSDPRVEKERVVELILGLAAVQYRAKLRPSAGRVWAFGAAP